MPAGCPFFGGAGVSGSFGSLGGAACAQMSLLLRLRPLIRVHTAQGRKVFSVKPRLRARDHFFKQPATARICNGVSCSCQVAFSNNLNKKQLQFENLHGKNLWLNKLAKCIEGSVGKVPVIPVLKVHDTGHPVFRYGLWSCSIAPPTPRRSFPVLEAKKLTKMASETSN
jgi:hypothetical protein